MCVPRGLELASLLFTTVSPASNIVPGTSRCSINVHGGHECPVCIQQVLDKCLLERRVAVNRGEVLGWLRHQNRKLGTLRHI